MIDTGRYLISYGSLHGIGNSYCSCSFLIFGHVPGPLFVLTPTLSIGFLLVVMVTELVLIKSLVRLLSFKDSDLCLYFISGLLLVLVSGPPSLRRAIGFLFLTMTVVSNSSRKTRFFLIFYLRCFYCFEESFNFLPLFICDMLPSCSYSCCWS